MDQFRFETHRATSLRHKITDDIRHAIFQGHLKPGSRLRESEMSQQMGVSRGPIREALRMLEQEGLLYSLPYKETMVAEVSGEEVTDVLIPIRLVIELFAVRKALPNIGIKEIERFRTIVAKMKEGADQQNLAKVVEGDLDFHEYLVRLSQVNNLMSIWTSIYNRIRLYFISEGQLYEDLNEICHGHERLLRTLEEGNPADISVALTAHIRDVHI